VDDQDTSVIQEVSKTVTHVIEEDSEESDKEDKK